MLNIVVVVGEVAHNQNLGEDTPFPVPWMQKAQVVPADLQGLEEEVARKK
jgi:hypothetical protein